MKEKKKDRLNCKIIEVRTRCLEEMKSLNIGGLGRNEFRNNGNSDTSVCGHTTSLMIGAGTTILGILGAAAATHSTEIRLIIHESQQLVQDVSPHFLFCSQRFIDGSINAVRETDNFFRENSGLYVLGIAGYLGAGLISRKLSRNIED